MALDNAMAGIKEKRDSMFNGLESCSSVRKSAAIMQTAGIWMVSSTRSVFRARAITCEVKISAYLRSVDNTEQGRCEDKGNKN